MLSIRLIRFCAWGLAAAGTTAAVLAVVLAASNPALLPVALASSDQRAATPSTRPAPSARIPFDDIPNLDLGRPLKDAAPARAESSEARPHAPVFRLLGAIVEPGHSMALLAGADGRPVLKSPGETIGSAELLYVDADRATLRLNGTMLLLRLRPEHQAGMTAAPDDRAAGARPQSPELPEHDQPIDMRVLLNRRPTLEDGS